MSNWHFGDIVVLRHVETKTSARMIHAILGNPAGSGGHPFLVDGRVVTVQARPYRVVQDSSDKVVLFQPEGTPIPRWLISEQRFLADPEQTRGESIRLLFPELPYDVTLFFETANEPPWFYKALFDGDGLQEGWREHWHQLRRGSVQDSWVPGERRRFRGWYVNLQTTRRARHGFDVVDLTLDVVVRPDRNWYWKDTDELALTVAKGACTPEQAASIRRAGEEVIKLIEAAAPPFTEEWIDWRAPAGWAIGAIPDGWQFAPALIED
jgi:hypothetical protein